MYIIFEAVFIRLTTLIQWFLQRSKTETASKFWCKNVYDIEKPHKSQELTLWADIVLVIQWQIFTNF